MQLDHATEMIQRRQRQRALTPLSTERTSMRVEPGNSFEKPLPKMLKTHSPPESFTTSPTSPYQ